MATLAIKGHITRGKEVIEILEMLGGSNKLQLSGNDCNCIYYNRNNGIIDSDPDTRKFPVNFSIFTLEEFIEQFPYKIGDKALLYGDPVFITKVEWLEWIEGSVACYVYYNGRKLIVPSTQLQPYKEQETMKDQTYLNSKVNKEVEKIKENLKEFKRILKEQIKIDIPKGYEFASVDNQQVVFEKVKSQYPKTYAECCKILELSWNEHFGFIKDNDCFTDEENKLIESFIKLKRCRDAYWKLYGNWKPDWTDDCIKYTITIGQNDIYTDVSYLFNYVLSFPTAEMRDEFYENFKDLIELCKELL